MNDLRTAAQQALEFLQDGDFVYPTQLADNLKAALAEPVQEPVWVCPDSAEHRYQKPGHCEDCGKTLVQVAEPVAWRYSTLGTWIYVDVDPNLWQDKPEGKVQALYLQQTTVCSSEEKNGAMLSEDSTTK